MENVGYSDSNALVDVLWIPAEDVHRQGRIVDWRNFATNGDELVTVFFPDDGTKQIVLASRCRIIQRVC